MKRYGFLILVAFMTDRLAKIWAEANLTAHGPREIHPLFTLTETYNRGLALGLFQGIGPLMGWLSLLIIAGLWVALQRMPREEWLGRAGLALMIGGALGNALDRIMRGAVLDFIATPLRPGVFNVADVWIYVGLALLLIGALWVGRRGRRYQEAGAQRSNPS